MRRIGRRCAAVLLVLVFALAPGAPAFASVEIGLTGEVTGISAEFGAGGYIRDGKWVPHGHIDDFAFLTGTLPGAEIFLPLRAEDFRWAGQDNVLPMAPRYLEQLGFRLEVEERRGGEVFDEIAIGERDGALGVLLDFVDEWPRIEEGEFELDAVFQAGGEEFRFLIKGTIKNRNRTVCASTTGTVQLGVGRMATGYADVDTVRFDLGCGVSITTDIRFAETVYGAAKETAREADQAVLDAHPQIVKTIWLDTVNLRGNPRIDAGELGVLHVYSANLTYLGTTAGPVRQEMLYYLATAKL